MSTGYDPKTIRKDFPLLSEPSGRLRAYLDSAASSQTPRHVLEAVSGFYERYRANVHRGMYEASERATERYEKSRKTVADFLGADESEIIFTSGTTHGLNLAVQLIEPRLGPGDEIVTTEMEHHANLIPWQQAAKRSGATLRLIPVREDYTLDMEAARRLIGPQTKFVAVTWASNVLGTVSPVAEICALAKEAGALSVVDAAQIAGHRPIDVRQVGCDFLAFSAHKMLGPTGTGALYGRRPFLDELEPVSFGGDMIKEVTFEGATWNEAPFRFEPGTPNIAGVIGLGAAIEYLNRLGIKSIWEHEKELTDYAFARLTEVEGLKVIGAAADKDRVGTIAFLVEGIHPHDLATVLDAHGVCVRAGHHCAMPLHHKFGIKTGTTRMSFGPYTLKEEIDALIEAVHKAKQVFRV